MTAEQFEQTLLQFIRRQPFEPFVVELLDGRLIEIASPKMAVGGGGASILTEDFNLVEFTCKEVREMRSRRSRSHVMSGDELQRALRVFNMRRPFRPFLMEFMSGDRVLLSPPEAVDRRGDLFMCRSADGIQRLITAASICQLLEAPTTSGNQ